MSRLRMSVEGLGAEDEVEDGNGATPNHFSVPPLHST
eukprot:CAMPEP_0206324454 /NCGR_PEP_ID=MMETSP0106_2-20121207/20522_1 /ASSEMBLY_ACC=CAM_ASM_000206 /TAXON_ID=81532 /ORGANISM="Acanthoeca-like sp., Strain 10tr" /LENGTH=36 /DNA_ID= /DNA_START= /DNA_END= /DNA_ORIENTATION=